VIFFPLHLGALLSTGQSHGLILHRDGIDITIVPIYDRRILWPFIQMIDFDEIELVDEAQAILDCLSKVPIDVRAACMKHIIVCGDEVTIHRIRQLERIHIDGPKSTEIGDDDKVDDRPNLVANFPMKSSIRFFREMAFLPLLSAWTGVSLVTCLPHIQLDHTRSMMYPPSLSNPSFSKRSQDMNNDINDDDGQRMNPV
jgi:hypothetical protein